MNVKNYVTKCVDHNCLRNHMLQRYQKFLYITRKLYHRENCNKHYTYINGVDN